MQSVAQRQSSHSLLPCSVPPLHSLPLTFSLSLYLLSAEVTGNRDLAEGWLILRVKLFCARYFASSTLIHQQNTLWIARKGSPVTTVFLCGMDTSDSWFMVME